MTQDERDKRDKTDMQFLVARPEFARFMFRVIQLAGIFQSTTNGSDGRNLVSEGRRSLGLDLLDMAESGQPIAETHPAGPLLTLIQALREETQQPTEKPNGRRTQYDRNNLDGHPDDDE